MSIYIEGIDMPKDGYHHMICIYADGTVSTGGRVYKGITVPPHGRLGELDKLENSLRHMAKYQYGERQQGILGCCETIRLAPTIIEASNKDVDATVKEET